MMQNLMQADNRFVTQQLCKQQSQLCINIKVMATVTLICRIVPRSRYVQNSIGTHMNVFQTRYDYS